MAKDLVCGMEVDELTAQWVSDYMGKTYYFCAPGCKRAFDVDPERYINRADMIMGHHGDAPTNLKDPGMHMRNE
ncbi:MAG: YHS domain-containing protein [Anaerolineales bacterium]|nr:YHS domain-containing protein [Anaerolineales bacterium]